MCLFCLVPHFICCLLDYRLFTALTSYLMLLKYFYWEFYFHQGDLLLQPFYSKLFFMRLQSNIIYFYYYIFIFNICYQSFLRLIKNHYTSCILCFYDQSNLFQVLISTYWFKLITTALQQFLIVAFTLSFISKSLKFVSPIFLKFIIHLI